MKGNMEERAERLALYIIENRSTVRAAAQKFGVSKSTVHMDIVKQNGGTPAAESEPARFSAPRSQDSPAERRRHAAVKERKLNYRFHDPNPAAAAAGYILKLFIEADAGKVEAAIREAAIPGGDEEPDRCQGHSA